jgi:hypothetical protein
MDKFGSMNWVSLAWQGKIGAAAVLEHKIYVDVEGKKFGYGSSSLASSWNRSGCG